MARQSKSSCPRSPTSDRTHMLGGPCCHVAVIAMTCASLMTWSSGFFEDVQPASPHLKLLSCAYHAP
eukprot:7565158-Prorocentrum_lima.AAC.1